MEYALWNNRTMRLEYDYLDFGSRSFALNNIADIRMARLWYEKARDLGSTEAARRLESLAGHEGEP
jgi:opacity protein-like surface antigen